MIQEWTYLIDALKDENYHLRVTNGNKWMIFDKDNKVWVVYQRSMYARNTKTLIETPLLYLAIDELVKD